MAPSSPSGRKDGRSAAYRIDEIEVTLRIDAGKIVAESNSGATDGELTVQEDGRSIRLVLKGAGRDRGSATLTVPEISRLRTHLDDILTGESQPEETASSTEGTERDGVISSGTTTLQESDGTIAIPLEREAIRELNLLDEDGHLVDDERQMQYTIFESGVLVADTRTEPEDFEF